MKKLVIVHGLRRSGNHAVINWMKGMERFLVFNNILPVKKVLREGNHLLEPLPYPEWIALRLKEKKREDLRKFRVASLLSTLRPSSLNVMASLEDQDFEVRPFCNISCPVKYVVLIRSARNLFASRIKKGFTREAPVIYPRDNGPRQQQVLALWKKYAAYACGEMESRPDTVPVIFDRWFADQDYRREIASALGLTFSDKGFSHVAREGGGSSFDGTSYGGENTRMNVLSREDNLGAEEKAVFDQMFEDMELRRLSEKLNGVSGRPSALTL